ncbi:MAG TPA: BlaI/MecI/CopY family transcriptional regulator [Terriglobia bacterium]|jgi:predicted transcriptional regulator|nr:BlaI/MecI/CopY family transcriptional regulator [Terriglobia bacterium]
MPRKTRNHPLDLPPLELDCMRALWGLGEGTVHEIRARLLPERALAYTTVTTVMDYLSKKDLVGRQKRGRSFVYQPRVSEETVREHALGRLTRNFFESSRERLRAYVLGERAAATAPAPDRREPPAEGRAPAIDPSLL